MPKRKRNGSTDESVDVVDCIENSSRTSDDNDFEKQDCKLEVTSDSAIPTTSGQNVKRLCVPRINITRIPESTVDSILSQNGRPHSSDTQLNDNQISNCAKVSESVDSLNSEVDENVDNRTDSSIFSSQTSSGCDMHQDCLSDAESSSKPKPLYKNPGVLTKPLKGILTNANCISTYRHRMTEAGESSSGHAITNPSVFGRLSLESNVESLSDKEIENDSVFGSENASMAEYSEELADAHGDTSRKPSQATSAGNSSVKMNASESDTDLEPPRKKKRRVKFNDVTVYFFQRKQGFCCVPSQGGSTLGMAENHMDEQVCSISDFAQAKKQAHKAILLRQHQLGRLVIPDDKLQQLQRELGVASMTSSPPPPPAAEADSGVQADDGDDDEAATEAASFSDDSDEEDLVLDDYYFLQPVPTRQRRVMLRQAGVKKIDTQEKDACKDIRTSREVCGCDCRGVCDPSTCICAQANIKCQVDRASFPCGCTKECCRNPVGRVEFNPMRVKTHFIHTLFRLENEKKLEQRRRALAASRERHRQMGIPAPTSSSFVIASHAASSSAAAAAAVASPTHVRFDDADRPVRVASPLVNDVGGDGDDSGGDVLLRFNSTEMGSCRDCQSSDVSQFLQQQQQQYRAAAVAAAAAAHAQQQQHALAQQQFNQQQQQLYAGAAGDASTMAYGDDTGAIDMFGGGGGGGFGMATTDDQDDSEYSESSEDCDDSETPPNAGDAQLQPSAAAATSTGVDDVSKQQVAVTPALGDSAVVYNHQQQPMSHQQQPMPHQQQSMSHQQQPMSHQQQPMSHLQRVVSKQATCGGHVTAANAPSIVQHQEHASDNAIVATSASPPQLLQHSSATAAMTSPAYGVPPFGSPTYAPQTNPLQRRLQSTQQQQQRHHAAATSEQPHTTAVTCSTAASAPNDVTVTCPLQPISEILNPLPFCGFGPSTSGLQPWPLSPAGHVVSGHVTSSNATPVSQQQPTHVRADCNDVAATCSTRNVVEQGHSLIHGDDSAAPAVNHCDVTVAVSNVNHASVPSSSVYNTDTAAAGASIPACAAAAAAGSPMTEASTKQKAEQPLVAVASTGSDLQAPAACNSADSSVDVPRSNSLAVSGDLRSETKDILDMIDDDGDDDDDDDADVDDDGDDEDVDAEPDDSDDDVVHESVGDATPTDSTRDATPAGSADVKPTDGADVTPTGSADVKPTDDAGGASGATAADGMLFAELMTSSCHTASEALKSNTDASDVSASSCVSDVITCPDAATSSTALTTNASFQCANGPTASDVTASSTDACLSLGTTIQQVYSCLQPPDSCSASVAHYGRPECMRLNASADSDSVQLLMKTAKVDCSTHADDDDDEGVVSSLTASAAAALDSDVSSKSETSSTGTTDDSEDSGLGSLGDDATAAATVTSSGATSAEDKIAAAPSLCAQTAAVTSSAASAAAGEKLASSASMCPQTAPV